MERVTGTINKYTIFHNLQYLPTESKSNQKWNIKKKKAIPNPNANWYFCIHDQIPACSIWNEEVHKY